MRKRNAPVAGDLRGKDGPGLRGTELPKAVP